MIFVGGKEKSAEENEIFCLKNNISTLFRWKKFDKEVREMEKSEIYNQIDYQVKKDELLLEQLFLRQNDIPLEEEKEA